MGSNATFDETVRTERINAVAYRALPRAVGGVREGAGAEEARDDVAVAAHGGAVQRRRHVPVAERVGGSDRIRPRSARAGLFRAGPLIVVVPNTPEPPVTVP